MIITALGFEFLLLLVSIAGLIRFKKISAAFKALTWLTVITLISVFLEKLYISRFHNNIPFTHLDAITNFSFISYAYYKLLVNTTVKKWVTVAIVVVILFFFINAIWLQPFFKQFSTNSSTFTLLVFVACALLLFKQMLSYPTKINIVKQSVLWFNTAILFYSTTMFLNFELENYYAKHMVHDSSLFYFWYFILYIFFILIGVSILIDKKEVFYQYAR